MPPALVYGAEVVVEPVEGFLEPGVTGRPCGRIPARCREGTLGLSRVKRTLSNSMYTTCSIFPEGEFNFALAVSRTSEANGQQGAANRGRKGATKYCSMHLRFLLNDAMNHWRKTCYAVLVKRRRTHG